MSLNELSHKLNQLEFNVMANTIREEVNEPIHNKYLTQKRKLENVLTRKSSLISSSESNESSTII